MSGGCGAQAGVGDQLGSLVVSVKATLVLL